MVEGVTDDAVETGRYVDATLGHEVVDVVDDNERRAEFPNTLANRVDDIIEVIPKDTEKVQTDKVELSVVGLEALKHFIVMMGAGVGAVDGVNPEHGPGCGCIGAANRNGVVDDETGNSGVLTREDGGGYHLGVVMGVASFLASDVGALVLADDGQPIDGNEGLDVIVVKY